MKEQDNTLLQKSPKSFQELESILGLNTFAKLRWFWISFGW